MNRRRLSSRFARSNGMRDGCIRRLATLWKFEMLSCLPLHKYDLPITSLSEIKHDVIRKRELASAPLVTWQYRCEAFMKRMRTSDSYPMEVINYKKNVFYLVNKKGKNVFRLCVIKTYINMQGTHSM